MNEGNGAGNGGGPRKIRIGRLAVDPIFLLLFLFFALSAFGLVFILWLAGADWSF